MLIIETPIFTQRIQLLMSDAEYSLLQTELIANPAAGKVIPGSGGLRKLRWKAHGKGKRGGAQIIYYWFVSEKKLLMLFAYAKNEMDDLTQEQTKTLKKIIEEEYK